MQVNSANSGELSGKSIPIGLFAGVSEPDGNATPIQTATLNLTGAVTTETLFTDLDFGTYWVYELDSSNHPIKSGGTIIADGKAYTVTETAPSVTLDVKGETENVAITNSRNTGGLSVTKHISGGPATSFAFTVTLGDTSINGTYGGMTFANGVATFWLENGQTVTAAGLPSGISYTVTETGANGYTATYTGETGTIPVNSTASAEFTNTYSANGSTKLSARKTFTNGSLSAHTFTFKVTQVNGMNSTTAVTGASKLSPNPKKAVTSSGNTNPQTVDLATLNFTHNDTGTYYFMIEEDTTGLTLANGIDSNTGIRYDTTPRWV